LKGLKGLKGLKDKFPLPARRWQLLSFSPRHPSSARRAAHTRTFQRKERTLGRALAGSALTPWS